MYFTTWKYFASLPVIQPPLAKLIDRISKLLLLGYGPFANKIFL
jgi:hypothetical protein